MSLLSKSNARMGSRKQIAIKEVKDGILMLPNNEYRLILETSSVNFELKSEAEQDVLIDSFQNFLNSLPCQLQIHIRTREVDIDSYLEQIAETKTSESQDVYLDQIDNYSQFIKNLVSGSKILSRRFYIIIPHKAEGRQSDIGVIKEQLNLTKNIVIRNLERLGMKARQLDSLEVLDLFYSFYNPTQAKTQELQGHTIEAMLKGNHV